MKNYVTLPNGVVIHIRQIAYITEITHLTENSFFIIVFSGKKKFTIDSNSDGFTKPEQIELLREEIIKLL